MKQFLERGINCITYKNGAQVNIADYARMAVRTASQRAHLMGEGQMRQALGNPLIKISQHATACPLCVPWETRILIDDVYSGGTSADGDYPLLSEAMEAGLYHPNCRHGSGTYYRSWMKSHGNWRQSTGRCNWPTQSTRYNDISAL